MSLSLAALIVWECMARPVLGTPVYMGHGSTMLEAKAAALASCKEAGHKICYAAVCNPVPPEEEDDIEGLENPL